MSPTRKQQILLSLYGVFGAVLIAVMIISPKDRPPPLNLDRIDIVSLQPACDYFPNGIGGKPCVIAP